MIASFLWCLFGLQFFTVCFGLIPASKGQCIKAPSKSLKISIVCQDLTSLLDLLEYIDPQAQDLSIISSNLTEKLDLRDEDIFKSLKRLSFKNSYLSPDALSWIYSLKNLKTLIINGCSTHQIINFENKPVSSLHLNMSSLIHLQSLKITRCNISNLDPYGVSNFDSIQGLSFPDNMFECTSGDFIWLLDLYKNRSDTRHSINLKNTTCFAQKVTKEREVFPAIYTIVNHNFITTMEYRRESIYNCPPKCNCTFKGVAGKKIIGEDGSDRPIINVDCSALNLTKFPSVIPKGTSRCNFSYNLIEDLTPYFKNKAYERVNYIALAHNRIQYFDANLLFEFLRKRSDPDVMFYLNHNRLTKFPAEQILTFAKELDRLPTFYLGSNPYICSCDYISSFRILIYRYMHHIVDLSDIKCSMDDPYNPGELVFNLEVEELCPPDTAFHTLDVINIILALLLILIVVNFIYNSYQYHKHRKLPWIIRKFNYC